MAGFIIRAAYRDARDSARRASRRGWSLGVRISRFVSTALTGTDPNRHTETAFLNLFLGAVFVVLFGVAAWTVLSFTAWRPFPNLFDGAIFEVGDSKEDAETLRNMFFALAGLVGALFGLFQLHNAARRTRISEDTSRTEFEAERNERFVKAAALLGNDDPAVQMAGVAALERLGMEQGANYADTAIEVLVSFVRNLTGPDAQARYRAEQGAEATATPDDNVSAEEDGDSKAPPGGPKRPTEPVFAAIRALSRLSHVAGQADETARRGALVDLRSCWLHGLDFPGIPMGKWRLQDANLGSANLWRANLRGADLGDANLRDADLGDAYLWDADLGGASLRGANLRDAYLGRANLRGANLGSANLGSANLRDAYLGRANLWRANLGSANLWGATLDFTKGVKADQLQQALRVTWPGHVPRPTEGPYSEAWEAEQAAKLKGDDPEA